MVKRIGPHRKQYSLLVEKLKRHMNTFRFNIARMVIRVSIWLADHISYQSALDVFLEEFGDYDYCPDFDRPRW